MEKRGEHPKQATMLSQIYGFKMLGCRVLSTQRGGSGTTEYKAGGDRELAEFPEGHASVATTTMVQTNDP